MLTGVTSMLTGLLSAIGSFLTPSAGTGTLLTAAGVTALGVLFSVPIGIKAGKKAFGLIRKI